LSFTSGTSGATIVATVNQFQDSTGVKATLSSDNKSVVFSSTGYGSNSFVTVSSNNTSALSTQDSKGVTQSTAKGSNATVTVNGTAVQSDGLNLNVVTADFQANFTLNSSANFDGSSKTFGVTGGGATFSLGAQVNTANTASIGIGN